MSATLSREQLDQLATSDNVRMRAIGVIGGWLADNYGHRDRAPAAARALIKTMTEADLLTFIGADLDAFIERRWRQGQGRGVVDSAQSSPEPS